VIAEYVLGAALEQLRFSRERYWKELRVPLPPSSALPRFDHRADVTQIGAVALALVIGRLLREDEFPNGAGDVLALASAISTKGEHQPLPASIRTWIGRALQLDPRHSFATVHEARESLDRVLSGDEDEDAAVAVAMSEPVSSATATSAVTPAPKPEGVADAPAEYVNPMSLIKPAEAVSVAPVALPPKPSISTPYTPLSPFAATSQPDFSIDSDEAEEVEEFSLHAAADWKRGPRVKVAAVAVALIAVSTVGVFGARKYLMPGPPPAVTGTLSINSNPPGATVVVDGQTGGITPLTLALRPGPHNVELQGAGEPRTVPVNITAGTTISQYVELPKMATAFGQLQVKTEPAGAQVTVDGIPRGKSPVLIEALAAGEHAVSLDSDSANVKQTVRIEAGVTASLVVPLGTVESAAQPGWVSVSAPVELQLYEGKRLLGSSQSDRVMVTAGKHEIELVNEIVGYRVTRIVQVAAGRVAPIKVEWPKGRIAINALPWADVWIDGERIGETPIGNLALPIGPHEILFRHPELGEQKYAATVTLSAPARVSVDLRKK
jgi:PEGA domain